MDWNGASRGRIPPICLSLLGGHSTLRSPPRNRPAKGWAAVAPLKDQGFRHPEGFDLTILNQKLHTLLTELSREHDLPGFAVCIRQDGHEVYAEGFGHCDAGAALPVSADTMFGVASVTKIVTAILVLQAQERKAINLAEPVSRHFPDLECASDQRMRLHHLLSHSAGFPGLPFRHLATASDGAGNGAPMRTTGDLVAGLNKLNPAMQSNPGDQVNYSNESFCLLGGLIETLHGCEFAQAADRFVFQPLGMTGSIVCGEPGGHRDLARPLVNTADGLKACGFWDAPLFYPAGGLVTSVRDMTRLISVLSGDSGILTAPSVSEMVSTRVPVASRPLTAAFYGLGLEITDLGAGRVLAWHTGQRPGISSFAGHVLPERLSVAFATNIADAPSASIGHRVIAEVLQGEVPPWPPVGDSVAPMAPERFTGRFGSQETGEQRVRLEQGALWLDLPARSRMFRFHGPNSGIVAGHTFCFLGSETAVSDAQQSNALALDLRVLPRITPS